MRLMQQTWYKNFFILLWSLFLINTAAAQPPCNEEIIMNIKGNWKKVSDFRIDRRAVSRVDKMQQLLLDAVPRPRGMEAKWYRTGPEHPGKNGPICFDMRAQFMSYYCNKNAGNKISLDEGNAHFWILANRLSVLADENDNFLIRKLPVYLLKTRTGNFKGLPLFEDIFTENTGNSGSRILMIARAGQLPYTPVTQKQYLEKFIEGQDKFYQIIAAMNNKMPVLSDAEEEIEKQKGLDQIEKKGDVVVGKERAKKYFLQNYISSKQKKENAIKESKRIYDENCKPAKELLATASAAELAKPAWFKDLSYESSFTAFAKENEGRELVLLNPGYFNAKLPDDVPQFLIVSWSWFNEIPCHYLINQLETHFNFSALVQLIDK